MEDKGRERKVVNVPTIDDLPEGERRVIIIRRCKETSAAIQESSARWVEMEERQRRLRQTRP